MGLDAFVNCTCLRDGKVKNPPFPLELVYFDQDGFLAVRGREEDSRANNILWDWREEACEHPNMDIVDERIGNWGGLRFFQDMLLTIGEEFFPVLCHELPDVNGGSLPAEMAGRALQELEVFDRMINSCQITCLIDIDTGEVIRQQLQHFCGDFFFSPLGRMRLNNDEFEIVVDDSILFRARRFEQHFIDTLREDSNYTGHVLFFNLDNGTEYQTTMVLTGDTIPWPDGRMENDAGIVHFSYPHFLAIETRKDNAENYHYLTSALRIVFQASVETGNPVHWC